MRRPAFLHRAEVARRLQRAKRTSWRSMCGWTCRPSPAGSAIPRPRSIDRGGSFPAAAPGTAPSRPHWAAARPEAIRGPLRRRRTDRHDPLFAPLPQTRTSPVGKSTRSTRVRRLCQQHLTSMRARTARERARQDDRRPEGSGPPHSLVAGECGRKLIRRLGAFSRERVLLHSRVAGDQKPIEARHEESVRARLRPPDILAVQRCRNRRSSREPRSAISAGRQSASTERHADRALRVKDARRGTPVAKRGETCAALAGATAGVAIPGWRISIATETGAF